MSEFQRYEFMTCDRPLARAELDAVNALSSHIEAMSTHAVVEYEWGDFKHDPIDVLYQFFDGFLYWANWGAPRLALRFSHGILPTDLLSGYDFDELVSLIRYPDFDVLDINFEELEGPDEWVDYELEPLIGIRDELMDGDRRALYIVWLAAQHMMVRADDEADYEEEDSEAEAPPVPPGMRTLTAAQQALVELLQVPQEMLAAAARHSRAATPSPADDVDSWIQRLPPDRRDDYLRRLAHNEPGLSRRFVQELRDLNPGRARASTQTGEHLPSGALLAESRSIKDELEREQREQVRLARHRHLQDIHDNMDDFWQQVDDTASSGTVVECSAVQVLHGQTRALQRL